MTLSDLRVITWNYSIRCNTSSTKLITAIELHYVWTNGSVCHIRKWDLWQTVQRHLKSGRLIHKRGIACLDNMRPTVWVIIMGRLLEFVGWSDVSVICGRSTISMLWGNAAYCVELSEGLSRYFWIKLNQLVYENARTITVLLRSGTTLTITNISQSLPHIVVGKQLVYIWYEEITSLSISV